MSPQRHPRESVVNAARADLSQKLSDWFKAHPDLTDGELFSILGETFGNEITALARALIRDERESLS